MNASGCHLQLFASRSTSAVRWRLLSGNNRELARGVQEYEDAESCRIELKELQSAVETLKAVIRQNEHRLWVWELSRPAGPIATPAHGFDRRIRCLRGLDHVRAALPSAELGNGLTIVESRRWGAWVS